jgi:UDP-glucose 4-epimerase
VYGDAVTIPMTEEHPYANLTVYGATKIAGEHLTKVLATRDGIGWVGLRYMNVYGPRQDYQGAYVAIIHEILDAIDRGGPVLVPGDGSQRYDFTSVDDVARANVLALASDVSGAFLNVATGVGTTLMELADLLMELRGTKVPISFTPSPAGLVSKRVGSIEAARSRLDFVAEVGLREGLQRLIEWRSLNRRTMSTEEGEAPAAIR